MSIERFIDYLQFTANIQESECFGDNYEKAPPIAFYQRGYRDENSTRIYFGNPKNPLLSLVVMSGASLQAYRNNSYKDTDVLEWCISRSGRFSRLDLAVTEWAVDNKKIILLGDVERWFKQGLIKSPLVKSGAKLITALNQELENTPETLYIGDFGKRAKKGIFRAYDKGIQMDLEPYLGTRLELELKRDKAHHAAMRIAKSGDIAGNFRASFDVQDDDFNRVMEAPAIVVQRGKAKPKQELEDEQAKRWDWLIKQVSPALRTAIEKDKSLGYADERLTQFLIASGLTGEMIKAVNHYVMTKSMGLIDTVNKT